MSNSGNRKERLGNQVREIVAQCILFEAKDPRLQSISITDVELSGDLRHAKVYFYVHQGDEKERTELKRALDRASGFLRSRLGQEIRSRHTPELVFYYDDSIERGAEMDEILRKVRQEDERIASLFSPEESSSNEDSSSDEE
jgi:ribosome-binding factor A